MMSVESYMHRPAVSCDQDATLAEVAFEMRRHNVGSVLVLSDSGSLEGIVTDRDLALALAVGLDGGSPVAKVVRTDVVTIPPSATLADAAQVMDRHAIRRLPVVDAQHRPVGMLSLDDLLASLVDEVITLQGAVRAQRAMR